MPYARNIDKTKKKAGLPRDPAAVRRHDLPSVSMFWLTELRKRRAVVCCLESDGDATSVGESGMEAGI